MGVAGAEEVKPSREPKLRLHGATKHAIETGRMRLVVTAGLVAVAFTMIGGRLIELMVLGDGPTAITRAREAVPGPTTTLPPASLVCSQGSPFVATHPKPFCRPRRTRST